MSFYENRQEVANKIDWEGGIYDVLFGYGITVDDLPENDIELRAALQAVKDLAPTFEAAVDRFTDLLPEPNEDY